MRLQQSDPVRNIGVHVMRPEFNFEPKYRVTILTREDLPKELTLLLQSRDSSGL